MLNISNLSFSYDGKISVLNDLNMELKNGELLAVMGPSGCGKSTLLSLIVGLLKPSGGSISSDYGRISFVFQEPRLFPWMTVEQNLRAVLSDKREYERIPEILSAVGLSGSERLYPGELSGGMKIRVSLARALLYGGDLFLLDEPFASLNEELREELCLQLRAHFKENGISAILVTHQKEDAERFADRLLMLPAQN